jgi:hypothetical protein
MTIATYRHLRHKPEVLPSSNGSYDLSAGEMNPAIYQRFAELLVDEESERAWEPFANPDGRTIKYFKEAGVDLKSASLESSHPDVLIEDSTVYSPDGLFKGVLFHPPYFGSKPFTKDSKDMSNITDIGEWLAMMKSAAEIAMEHLTREGVVCAVGRRYRHGGKEIRLDEWLVEAFKTMKPTEVWISEPDVAIILRFKK